MTTHWTPGTIRALGATTDLPTLGSSDLRAGPVAVLPDGAHRGMAAGRHPHQPDRRPLPRHRPVDPRRPQPGRAARRRRQSRAARARPGPAPQGRKQNRLAAVRTGSRGQAVNSPQDQDAAGPQPPRSPRPAGDRLITITDIRRIFGLGRTAAYDLTHRPDFPGPVSVSPRCYRWWASEVNTFAEALRLERSRPSARPTVKPRLADPATPTGRISGRVRAARGSRTESP